MTHDVPSCVPLQKYLDAFRAAPGEPLISLCVAVVLLRGAFNRKLYDRHGSVLKAFAFLFEYATLRATESPSAGVGALAREQEVSYNLGRGFQYLGLRHMAVPWYERALELHRSIVSLRPASEPQHRSTLVTQDAAHNLILIYRESGAANLAHGIAGRFLAVI